MNVDLFLETLWTPALLTSPIFGALIGAFYGYPLARESVRTVYPTQLWIVGIGWLVSIAILAAFGETPFLVEPQFARAILWTMLCIAIPIGRAARIYFAVWRFSRRTKKLEE